MRTPLEYSWRQTPVVKPMKEVKRVILLVFLGEAGGEGKGGRRGGGDAVRVAAVCGGRMGSDDSLGIKCCLLRSLLASVSQLFKFKRFRIVQVIDVGCVQVDSTQSQRQHCTGRTVASRSSFRSPCEPSV